MARAGAFPPPWARRALPTPPSDRPCRLRPGEPDADPRPAPGLTLSYPCPNPSPAFQDGVRGRCATRSPCSGTACAIALPRSLGRSRSHRPAGAACRGRSCAPGLSGSPKGLPRHAWSQQWRSSPLLFGSPAPRPRAPWPLVAEPCDECARPQRRGAKVPPRAGSRGERRSGASDRPYRRRATHAVRAAPSPLARVRARTRTLTRSARNRRVPCLRKATELSRKPHRLRSFSTRASPGCSRPAAGETLALAGLGEARVQAAVRRNERTSSRAIVFASIAETRATAQMRKSRSTRSGEAVDRGNDARPAGQRELS